MARSHREGNSPGISCPPRPASCDNRPQTSKLCSPTNQVMGGGTSHQVLLVFFSETVQMRLPRLPAELHPVCSPEPPPADGSHQGHPHYVLQVWLTPGIPPLCPSGMAHSRDTPTVSFRYGSLQGHPHYVLQVPKNSCYWVFSWGKKGELRTSEDRETSLCHSGADGCCCGWVFIWGINWGMAPQASGLTF